MYAHITMIHDSILFSQPQVKQYQDAVGHITAGRNAAASELLKQLLQEPLLQDCAHAKDQTAIGRVGKHFVY